MTAVRRRKKLLAELKLTEAMVRAMAIIQKHTSPRHRGREWVTSYELGAFMQLAAYGCTRPDGSSHRRDKAALTRIGSIMGTRLRSAGLAILNFRNERTNEFRLSQTGQEVLDRINAEAPLNP